jgi:DNA polymerase alpha subunit B
MDVETEQAEGKLHDGALYLETSKMIDAGTRGLIRFNTELKIRGARPGTSSVGFFPGAIAALKGRNATGDWFQVSEVLSVSNHSNHSCLCGFGPTTSVTLIVTTLDEPE